MTRPFVLDANVVLAWILDHELSEAAAPYRSEPFIAPALILSEVANTIWKHRSLGDVRMDLIESASGLISSMAEEIVPDLVLVVHAGKLAVALNHPIYDCLYLALAQQRGAPLVTADGRLAEIAQRLAIDVRMVRPQASLT